MRRSGPLSHLEEEGCITKGEAVSFKMERRPQPPGGDGKEYKYAVIWPSKATSAQS